MGLDVNFYKGKKVSVDDVKLYNNYSKRIIRETEARINDYETYYEETVATAKIIDEKENLGGRLVDVVKLFNLDLEEIQYFRKHSDLHGYIGAEYADVQTNGLDNCVYFVLYKEDIEKLLSHTNEVLADEDNAEEYSGFFWGQSDTNKWLETRDMCDEILKEYSYKNNDFAIYYLAWY